MGELGESGLSNASLCTESDRVRFNLVLTIRCSTAASASRLSGFKVGIETRFAGPFNVAAPTKSSDCNYWKVFPPFYLT